VNDETLNGPADVSSCDLTSQTESGLLASVEFLSQVTPRLSLIKGGLDSRGAARQLRIVRDTDETGPCYEVFCNSDEALVFRVVHGGEVPVLP